MRNEERDETPDAWVDRQWSRAELLRNATGSAGLLALGGGAGVGRILAASDALATAVQEPVSLFHTRPDLRPPLVKVLHATRTADGYLFIAPSSGPGQRGVLILDNTGEVVWFKPTTPHTAMNFRTAVYKGEPVLTWWEGKADRGLGRGEHVIVDSSYRDIARFPAGHGRQSDLHEFLLTERGTALVTSYEVPDDGHHRVRRRGERQGDRRHRPGAGDSERTRPLRVEEPRPCRRRGDACTGDRLARLLPRQLDRRRRRRESPRLRAQHVGRLQAQSQDRRGDLAARRQAERLRDGEGDRVCVAARRPPPARRTSDPRSSTTAPSLRSRHSRARS